MASATACCCSRVGSLDAAPANGVAVLDCDLGEAQALPVADARGAVDRDRHDRRAALQGEAADAALGLLGHAAGARAPALAVHRDGAAAGEDRLGGDERLLVACAAAHGKDAAGAVDVAHGEREQLRLGHEANLAADVAAHQEVIHEREVVGREDDRAGAGNLLGGDRARAQQRVGVERGDQARGLVHPVGLARAGAGMEAVEVLGRPGVGVDLFAHRCEIVHLSGLQRRVAEVTRGWHLHIHSRKTTAHAPWSRGAHAPLGRSVHVPTGTT